MTTFSIFHWLILCLIAAFWVAVVIAVTRFVKRSR